MNMRSPLALLFFIVPFFSIPFVMAQKGKHGIRNINSSTIVNEFTSLTSDALAGSTSITVANSGLNDNIRFAGPLASGDLIMVIQMQGAAIKGNINDSTWGTVVSYNNCGFYQFVQVAEVINLNTIKLSCPLQNNYSSAGKVQVIRIPRFSSLNINNGGILTTIPWNGSIGGVLAVEVSGATSIDAGGFVDVTGLGFRGGGIDNLSSVPGTFFYASQAVEQGGEKGESIAGYQAEYTKYGGQFSRGAPANGGGGGNNHNAGGGGGANAGNISLYNGNGNPDISNINWIKAWELEYFQFSQSTSSGGGRGGYTFGFADLDALIAGPGDSTWGGDYRRNSGGKGGRPLDYSTGRLFLGGGGGSGDANNGNAGGAGAGGGLVYILSYNTISGNGTINANGANGLNTTGIGIDAAGGAGGGGTVILNASGTISGISVNANGGKGGNQIVLSTANPAESEGPGGGGGGGYIAISNGTISRSSGGGQNGTTTSLGVSEFTANGATKGGAGIANATITNYNFTLVSTNDTICSGNQAQLSAITNGSTPPNTIINWYDSSTGGTFLGTGNSFTTPVLTQNTTYYLSTCPSVETAMVTAIVKPAPVAAFNANEVCLGDTTMFSNLSSSTAGDIAGYEWNFGDGSLADLSQNPTHIYSTAGTFNVTLNVKTASNCNSSVSSTVVVSPLPVAAFTANPPSAPITNPTVSFTDNSTGATNWFWDFGDGTSISGIKNPSHDYPGLIKSYTVQLIVVNNSGCTDTIQFSVNIIPQPLAGFNVKAVCLGDVSIFTDFSFSPGESISSREWNFGDGSPLNYSKDPVHIYAAAGKYPVTLKITTTNNYTSSFTDTATVFPVPKAGFSLPIEPASVYNPQVSFTDNSVGADSWHWNFGDGESISEIQNPVHTYPAGIAATYNAQLIVVNKFGCSDLFEFPVEIIPEFAFYAPNSFTPNEDGVNDYFSGSGVGIAEYEMWIFDRWGLQVFYTNDLFIQWDGKFQNGKINEICPQDVYVWKVLLKDVFSKKHEYIGHVSLLKNEKK